MEGMIISEIKNTNKIFMDATIPNSTNICVCVITKVAKPAAVVALVIKVALPTF